MRSLRLLFLFGLVTGFISEKHFVSSQSPFSVPDDLYLEGQSSGLPIDDEDADDDGSGSGSGDYGTEDLLSVFLNFTKTIFNDMAPFLPQPTADPTHNLPTTAAGSQGQTTPNIFPTDDNRAKEVPTVDWFMTNNNPSSTSMPPSETTAPEFSIDISVTEDTDTWDVSTIQEIEEVMIRKDVNNAVASSGEGSRYVNAPEQVTSESTWEKKEVLAAVIACGVIGFLCAVVLLILLVYRLKKKDEGSYDLGDTKLSATAYQKAPTKEFYA